MAGTSSDTGRTTQELDYAIPKTVTHTRRQIGDIKRLTVAVLLDANAISKMAATAGGTDATETPGEQPAPFDLKGIAEIVKNTVGFNGARGDKVELMVLPFVQPEMLPFEEPVVVKAEINWVPIGLGGLGALFLLMFGIYMSRRRKERESAAKRSGDGTSKEAETLSLVSDERNLDVHVPGRPEIKTIHDAVRGIRAQMASGASQSLRDEVRRFAQTQLDSTAALVKEWVATSQTKTVEDENMNISVQQNEGRP
jgi:flagellar M-ring protein FliF